MVEEATVGWNEVQGFARNERECSKPTKRIKATERMHNIL